MGRKDPPAPAALVQPCPLVHSPKSCKLDGSFVVVKGVSGTSHLSVKMPRVTMKSPQPERRTNQGRFRDRFGEI